MFAYCPPENIIPSLTFTKAELVYSLAFLLRGIQDTDNSTRIEMVELRHYLNQIKDKIALSITDGTIVRAMTLSDELALPDMVVKQEKADPPSIEELKARFPNLSETEIQEVIDRARDERMRKEEMENKILPPKPPSFIAKKVPVISNEKMKPIMTAKEKHDLENSIKFSKLLGEL